MAAGDAQRLDEKIDGFAERLPRWAGRSLRWLRSPSARWVRVPIALLLIGGGFVGFLPILGFWMVPLGALLLAQDVPFLQRPLLRLLTWVGRQWLSLKLKLKRRFPRQFGS